MINAVVFVITLLKLVLKLFLVCC